MPLPRLRRPVGRGALDGGVPGAGEPKLGGDATRPVTRPHGAGRVPVFDLDGTLLDSDEALAAPFVALGVPRHAIAFGALLADECARLGIDPDAYLDHYDDTAAHAYPGVEELVAGLGRWGICSNKHPRSGRAELRRLGWRPEVALFSDAFDGPKRLGPVLGALGLGPDEVVFVGDTEHDRACAAAVGCPFWVAGWNERTAGLQGEALLTDPREVLDLLG